MADTLTNWQRWCALKPGRAIPDYDPDATAAPDDYFDASVADAAIEFIAETCIHIHGKFAGHLVILESWQEAIVGALFGWKRADGLRRYRKAFIEIARKNGKSLMVACIVILMLFFDSEPGAELYSAAGDEDQAGIVFRMVATMVERSPYLSELATVHRGANRIFLDEDKASIYRSITSTADTKHGGNTHFAVVDELHAQKNEDLCDVLETSMGTRTQPMMIYITTADFYRQSICNTIESLALRICSGEAHMREFLPVVYHLDAGDDWHDEEAWKKANPNLGVSISMDYLREKHQKACEIPSFENTFKRLHLNIKTQTNVRWLSMDDWNMCGDEFDKESLRGIRCWGGLDLSTTTDITAFELCFAPVDEESPVFSLSWFWVPEDNMRKREKADGVPYSTWASQGWIEATPGNVVDQKLVEKRIVEIASQFKLQEIGYDPHQAANISQSLQDAHGIQMIEMRQGIVVMNEPCKELEKLVTSQRLRHGGNPVLTWMAGNSVTKSDGEGKIKIDKGKSTERVDGMVALAMAIGRMKVGANKVHSKSYIEDSEVMVL